MRKLVLAGGGHAHLHVLKCLSERRISDINVTLVSPYSRQIYSGMLPGWISGHYELAQCAIDLKTLASKARVNFIRDHVTMVDPEQKLIYTEKSGPISYDVLSLDIGAETDISSLAATEAPLCPIRPLEHFVVTWDTLLKDARDQGFVKIIIAGGGAAGVELALSCRYRLSNAVGAESNQVHLVSGNQLLPGHGRPTVHRVEKCLKSSGIHVHRMIAVGEGEGVRLSNGEYLSADLVIAATGVRPMSWIKESGLVTGDDGFISVGHAQQSISHPSVFATGDISSRIDTPHPKSGVYAVRAGPMLAANLMRQLNDGPVLPYYPKKRSLYLLATGDRSAVMSWAGFSLSGNWVWRWKDWIDRRFVSQYVANQEPGGTHVAS